MVHHVLGAQVVEGVDVPCGYRLVEVPDQLLVPLDGHPDRLIS
jgi:hypothetical protein